MKDAVTEFLEDVKTVCSNLMDPDLLPFDRMVYGAYLLVYCAVAAGVIVIGGGFLWYGGDLLFGAYFR